MAFFHPIGKFIAASGGPSIRNECGVIANGSLCGFLSGKHYNRCKWIHPLFAVAIEIMHFKLFLERNDDDRNLLNNVIADNLLDMQYPHSSPNDVNITKELRYLYERYIIFKLYFQIPIVEQTINADAAIPARQRYDKSHFLRIDVVSHL